MSTEEEQAAANPVEIQDLFSYSRFPTSNWRILLLCLYAPFGLVLGFIRLFLAFHAFVVSCALRKSSKLRCTVLRVLCAILGYVVVEEGYQDETAKVIVSNHLSPFDHTCIELIRPCVLPSVWDLPELLTWCFGYADLGARLGRTTLIQRAKQFCIDSELALLAFPEGAQTNGRVAMLKFNSWPFCLEQDVQPAVLSVHRPAPFDLPATVLGSRWWTDNLWVLFLPYTVFKVRWLSKTGQQTNESTEEFTRRVEALIGQSASLRTTSFTSHDAVDYAKRRVLEEERRQRQLTAIREQRRITNRSRSGIELDSMAFTVKQMFPQVPLHVIRKDLERTGETEATASNIIEGRLPYTEEQSPPAKVAPNTDPSSWRSIYDQRKWAIIEENRTKYMQRKGISDS